MNNEFTVSSSNRYKINNLDKAETPRLMFFDWAIEKNLKEIKNICPDFNQLRLMAKTCKASSIINRYCENGLNKVKVSCVQEARIVARNSSVKDILVAFPCLGPMTNDFLTLQEEFPEKIISITIPNIQCARELSKLAKRKTDIYLDIDSGMKRTGTNFGVDIMKLAQRIRLLPHLVIKGLHIYDGHIHHPNFFALQEYSKKLMKKIDETIRMLNGKNKIQEVVTSSSLTMRSNMLAYQQGKYHWQHTVSPGTAILWDSNYNDLFPGVFEYAVAIAVRILDYRIYRKSYIVTTDCGIKIGASIDCGQPHVFSINGYQYFGKSERFGCFSWLAFDRRTRRPIKGDMSGMIGKVFLLFPRHICTTLNQFSYGFEIKKGVIEKKILIDARDG